MLSNKNLKVVMNQLKLRANPYLQGDRVLSYRCIRHFTRRMSIVYKCRVRFADRGQTEIIIKILRPYWKSKNEPVRLSEQILTEYKKTIAAFERFPELEFFKIPKAICVLPDSYALVTEAVYNGNGVDHLITKTTIYHRFNNKAFSKLKDIIYSCGTFLAYYHKCSIVNESFSENEQNKLKEYLFIRVRKIGELFKDKVDGKTLACVECFIDDALCELVKIDRQDRWLMVDAQGDFSPANILYTGKLMALIDFADCRPSPRYLDIGCFINYLSMLSLNKIYFQYEKMEELKSHFIQGYKTVFPEINDSACKLFKLRYLMTNLITQAFDSQRSIIHKAYYKPRISRYIKALTSFCMT